MMRKMTQQSGETLIEALVSLMIALLSMSFLTTAVMSANNVNLANRERDAEYEEQLYKAEGMAIESVKKGMLHIKFDTLGEKNIEVNLYGGDSNYFLSYEEKETEESEP